MERRAPADETRLELEKKTNCPGCGVAVWYLPASTGMEAEALQCPKCGQSLLVMGEKVTGTSNS